MFEKVYELGMTRSYVAGWQMPHAVREIIQNALDSDSPFEWQITDDELIITSRYTTLSHSTLLLGKTTKAENKAAIGSFGEGYKIALLVLAREGYIVEVRNGDTIWTPMFRMSKQFGAEVFCIEERRAPRHNEGLSFVIRLKEADDEERIRACCLQMQDNIGEVIETPKGQILVDRKGELFVGGLYICRTQLKCSYNIKPEYMQLERDRQTVSNWELQSITRDMWFATDQIERIVDMIEKDIADLYHADIGTPKIVADACYRRFKEKHPGAVIARTQEELERLVDAGLTKVIIAGGSVHYAVVRGSRGYQEQPKVQFKTPTEVLSEWIEKYVPDVAEDAKKEILAAADRWMLR